jgi:Tol biopolymer transport system component
MIIDPNDGAGNGPSLKGRILYSAYTTNTKTQIYSVDSLGKGAQMLTTSGNNYWPAWSPDYTRIAFASVRPTVSGYTRGIFVMDSDGTDEIQVTFPVNAEDVWPTWSPDGKRIAFFRRGNWVDGLGPQYTLHLLTVKQGTLQAIATFATNDVRGLSWSPDGTRLLFTRDSASKRDLFTARTDGSGLTRLTTCFDYGCRNGRYSPDGTSIAFVGGFDREIRRMPAAGGPATRLIEMGSSVEALSWSPDGSKILFNARPEGATQNELLTISSTPQPSPMSSNPTLKRLTNTSSVAETMPAWSR